MTREPERLYRCPGCEATVLGSRLNPPEGVASCDKCQVRLGLRGNLVKILAQTGSDDLSPEVTAQLLRDELDKGLIVSHLRKRGRKAFVDPKVCEAIRRTGGYVDMLAVVDRHAKTLEHDKRQAVAEALQGAYLLDEETLPEDTRIGFRLTPARLRAAVRWAKRQHPKFARRSKKFLTRLNDYRESVQQLKSVIDGPEAILLGVSNLERAIRGRVDQAPRVNGMPFRDFQKSRPHILASIRIVSLLQASKRMPKSQATRSGAIRVCVEMLCDADLALRKRDSDAKAKLWQSVSRAIDRGTRKQSH
jgi:hypothetical protein